MTVLTPIASKWRHFSAYLKLTPLELHGKPTEQLEKLVKLILEQSNPKPTWRMIVDGLCRIRENSLADELEQKYCEMIDTTYIYTYCSCYCTSGHILGSCTSWLSAFKQAGPVLAISLVFVTSAHY